MNHVKIHLENCFGIKNFLKDLDFTQHRSILIYAPNGTMKTSFSDSMRLLSQGKANKINDRIHPEKTVVCDVKDENGIVIAPKDIYVANADEDVNSEERFSSFLADAALKARYDAIYAELAQSENVFLTSLRQQSKSDNCKDEFVEVFSLNKDVPDSFLQCLYRLKDELDTGHEVFDFKYNNIFDAGDKVKNIVDKYKDALVDYFNRYSELLTDSSLFSSSVDGKSFGSYQANELIKATKDDTFFKASHHLTLSDGTEIKNVAQLKTLVNDELGKIAEDEELKINLAKITKALDANEQTRLCKVELERNPALVAHLIDYEKFQKDFWLGCLVAKKDEAKALVAVYEAERQELQQILAEANAKLDAWNKIVRIYNERFHVPFTVSIENTKDIILKQDTAKLKFTYKDKDGTNTDTKKKDLEKILSRGERRAFHIMQIIFEIEARKREGNDTLVVFDDIADSFDYQNKFAIIEYIKDMNDAGIFKTIVLTHNFDFYRTLSSRLGLGNSVFMTNVSNDGTIELKRGQYRKDLFSYLIDGNHDNKQLISIIPFARNLIEYMEGQSMDYIKLTSCMHVKQGQTDVLTINDIISLVKGKFPQRCQTLKSVNPNKKIKDFIYSVAESIVAEPNLDPIKIENKICLSIACRLKVEDYMISKMAHDANLVQQINSIRSNQASKLFELYKGQDSNHVDLIEEVNMMTPEGIHLNSFMYEPLIDMSAEHLVKLYNRCKNELV